MLHSIHALKRVDVALYPEKFTPRNQKLTDVHTRLHVTHTYYYTLNLRFIKIEHLKTIIMRAKYQFRYYEKTFAVMQTGVLISPQPDQEGNKLQRQKILMFIYPIYYHTWRNITNIYITRLASNEIFPPSNKIYREVGRAKDLSALCITNIELFA